MIEKLASKFQVVRRIGSGGMAQIFLAKNTETNMYEAIKILESSFQHDLAKRKRFMHEMRLLKKVDSPYVVKYFGGKMDPETCYLRMEYVDGEILKTYIANRSRLTIDETVEFAKQLALGFDEIHNNGIIHRDIKAHNIMVTDSGRIKIVDFGIALDANSERVTRTDMLIGSPQYVSPELINQEEPSKASDIYALGILLYEMLTGEVPFSGKNALETLRMHQNNKLPRIATIYENVPIALENIVIKATNKDKYKRYRTMYEMYLDLKNCLKSEHTNDKLLNLDGKEKMTLVRFINSKWFLVGLISLLILILITIIIVLAVAL